MLRVVVVLALIAMLGVIFTKAVISMSGRVKNSHQNSVHLVDNNLNEIRDNDSFTDIDEDTATIPKYF